MTDRRQRFTLRDSVRLSDHVLIYEPAQTGIVATSVANLAQFLSESSSVVTWADVANKPTTFPPVAHTHQISEVTGLQSALDGKQAAGSYLTGESDPVFSASPAGGITSGQVSNWNTAFSWGNHASAGYVSTATLAAHIGTGGAAHANATGSVAGFMSAADKTKLDGVASGATQNATDAALRDRATHTGTQAFSTITGTVPVAQGGTNITSYTANNYIRAQSATVLEQRTPAQVLSDIAAAPVVHNHTSATLTDFAEATRTQVENALIAGAGITITPGSSGSTRTLTLSASASGPAGLGLWDYWYLYRISTTGAAAGDMFVGAAVSSGTNSTAIPTTGQAGYNSHGVFLRSSTTANGGYRYQTSSLVADYFGTISHKFRCQFMWPTGFVGRMVRIGYHDSTTSADAVDGAYFEIDADLVRAKTANNSTRTTHPTVLNISGAIAVPLTFDIEVNAAGTLARFRVYDFNNSTPIYDQTIDTNIPTTVARAFGAGIVATESSTTASDIGILYSLGMGTIEGFNRLNG